MISELSNGNASTKNSKLEECFVGDEFDQCVRYKNTENSIVLKYKLHVGNNEWVKLNSYIDVTKISNSNIQQIYQNLLKRERPSLGTENTAQCIFWNKWVVS